MIYLIATAGTILIKQALTLHAQEPHQRLHYMCTQAHTSRNSLVVSSSADFLEGTTDTITFEPGYFKYGELWCLLSPQHCTLEEDAVNLLQSLLDLLRIKRTAYITQT